MLVHREAGSEAGSEVRVSCKPHRTSRNRTKKFYQHDPLNDPQDPRDPLKRTVGEQAAETRLVKWNAGALSIMKNRLSRERIKVSVNIAIDGAAHTKNKCKSKSDKHAKGLRQRATQRKNAEKRIKTHQFAFTN